MPTFGQLLLALQRTFWTPRCTTMMREGDRRRERGRIEMGTEKKARVLLDWKLGADAT